ncbi:MAG: PEGA domain-containing protein [Deltaproteobacteria bacterium]|nr:PEGA domain-containing protein [Deltaproteobacteria bacterium]
MSCRAQILALLLASAVSSEVRADARSDALERFREGSRLFAAHDYAGARAAFEEAHRILPNARVLGNIATCLAAEGRPADAVTAFRRFLHDGGSEVPAAARREAERQIRSLGASVGDLLLAVDPAGAEVLIDGNPAGTIPVPWPIAVQPGSRLIEIRAPGYLPISRTVEVVAGREHSLSAVLQPVPAEPAPPPSAPLPGPAVETAEVSPPAPTTSPPSRVPPPRAPLGRGPLLWTGVAATGALAVAAAVTGLLALARLDEYEAEGTSVERRRELFDSTSTLTDVTDVLVWSAIACAAATTALYLLAGPRTESEPAPGAASTRLEGGARWNLALGF